MGGYLGYVGYFGHIEYTGYLGYKYWVHWVYWFYTLLQKHVLQLSGHERLSANVAHLPASGYSYHEISKAVSLHSKPAILHPKLLAFKP